MTFNVSSAKGAAWELVLVDVVLALVALGCWSCLVVLTDVVHTTNTTTTIMKNKK